MEKVIFHEHLILAAKHSFECARRFVHNYLPESFLYLVCLNQSYDGNPLKVGEYVFPDDIARHGTCAGPMTNEQAVELLWRNKLIPEWIDISVERADGEHTFLKLRCCGRFTERKQHLYHLKKDTCPFSSKSPVLPLGWRLGDKPFDLHWAQKSKV